MLSKLLPTNNPESSLVLPSERTEFTNSLYSFRQVGLGVLGLQLVWLLLWSNLQSARFSLTWDFAIYHQAWWLIGHGVLNPFETMNGYPFWSSHGEIMMWPLAVLGRLWPHAVTLLWIQDIFLVWAEVIAFNWICDFAAKSEQGKWRSGFAVLLAATGLILLVADPWIYWTAAWDFHMEVVGLLFCLLTARQIYRDPTKHRIWLWVALGLMCGDVTATYIAGIGFSSMLVGTEWRRTGTLVASAGVGWMLMLTAIGANKASSLATGYGYLVNAISPANSMGLGATQIFLGVLEHPFRAVTVLWDRRVNIYGVLAPGGLIGVFWPLVAVPIALVLLENGLNSYGDFIVPGFQDALLFLLVPIGTIAVLFLISRNWHRITVAISVVLAMNSIVWGTIWIPRTSAQWINVSPPAAKVLSSILHQIGPQDEVMMSQGMVGRFSGRKWVYAFGKSPVLPIHTSPTWVIVSPNQGIGLVTPAASEALIGELATNLHARLVTAEFGVWAFRWMPPPSMKFLVVPSSPTKILAWTTTGSAGRATYHGLPATWIAESNGTEGYVVAGDYWREPRGKYMATVRLSTNSPVNIEVWNTTGGALLSRRKVGPTHGMESVRLLVNATRYFTQDLYGGKGIFRISPLQPPSGDALEIRIWTSGRASVQVSSLGMTPLTS